MNFHKIIIFNLELTSAETYAQCPNVTHHFYEDLGAIVNKLFSEAYRVGFICKSDEKGVNTLREQLHVTQAPLIIKTVNDGLNTTQIMNQMLDELKCCKAIVVGFSESAVMSAHQTHCLSILITQLETDQLKSHADFFAKSIQEAYDRIHTINTVYRPLALNLLEKKSNNKPLIVGINGVDTSGKTMFAEAFSRYLKHDFKKIQLIHMDDFHNPSEIRSREPDPVISYYNNAFRLEVLEAILKKAANQGMIHWKGEILNLETNQYDLTREYCIDQETIVLIEGVLLYRPPIDAYFDFKIFIDISFDQVLKRALARDEKLFGALTTERYLTKYIPIQKLYMDRCSPKEKSHCVVNNENYFMPFIETMNPMGDTVDHSMRLIPYERKYLESIREMYQDTTAIYMLGVNTVPSSEDFEADKGLTYIILNEAEAFVGIVELFNISWRNKRAELSINIHNAFRQKGYGYKALSSMLQEGFMTLGLNRISLRVLENNHNAMRLYKQIGFVEEGICREESLRNGKFENQIQMSLLRSEWLNLK